jgi:hypothetical protein
MFILFTVTGLNQSYYILLIIIVLGWRAQPGKTYSLYLRFGKPHYRITTSCTSKRNCEILVPRSASVAKIRFQRKKGSSNQLSLARWVQVFANTQVMVMSQILKNWNKKWNISENITWIDWNNVKNAREMLLELTGILLFSIMRLWEIFDKLWEVFENALKFFKILYVMLNFLVTMLFFKPQILEI